jgi:thioredoxin reductase (NADPH)
VQDKLTIDPSLDAIIIGGGPAGSSCALWLKLLGYHPCIIDKHACLGGLQNDSPYPNPWIAGLPGLTGQEIAKTMHEQIISHDISCYLQTNVTKVESVNDGYFIHIESDQGLSGVLFAPHLVLACGVKPASGELTPSRHLLIGPGEQIENYPFTGKNVAILGGGDNAFENYLFIQQKQPKLIHIYARQDINHEIKARCEFLERVPGKDVHCYAGELTINSRWREIN